MTIHALVSSIKDVLDLLQLGRVSDAWLRAQCRRGDA